MTSSNRLKLKQLGSLRIFIVTEDGTDRAGRPVKAGSVVILRRDRAIPDIYENIYDALRSRTEIICAYGFEEGRSPAGELRQLADTRERLQRAWTRLEAGEGAAGGSAAKNIRRVARDLRCKHDPAKSEARRRAQAGPVRTPVNRRLNQAATQARVAALDGLLAERESTVVRIVPWIKAQEAALRLEVDRSFDLAGRLVRDIDAMTSGHEFFVRGRTTPNQLKGIAARLRILRQRLDPLEAEPFRSFRRLAGAAFDRAAAAAAAGDAVRVERSLDEVIVLTDRVLLQRAVEALAMSAARLAVTGPARQGLARLERQAAEVAELCADAELSSSYRPQADEVRAVCARLRSGRLPAADDRAAVVAELTAVKEALKAISRRLLA